MKSKPKIVVRKQQTCISIDQHQMRALNICLPRFVNRPKLEGMLRARLLLFSRRISKFVIKENCNGISPSTLVSAIESSTKLVKDRPKEAGSLPPRSGIPTMDNCTKFVSSLRLVAISPVKRLGPNESEVSVDTPERATGVVPVKTFPPIARSVRGKSKRESGSVPENAFDSTLKIVRSAALLIDRGTDPFRLFIARFISVSLVRWEKEESSPDKALSLKFTESKLPLVKYDLGMDPNKLLLAT